MVAAEHGEVQCLCALAAPRSQKTEAVSEPSKQRFAAIVIDFAEVLAGVIERGPFNRCDNGMSGFRFGRM